MSGVVWERLTADDPLLTSSTWSTRPGSASCPQDDMVRHGGREYGVIVSGRLEVQVGFETYSLGPGDSIHFDSSTPHRLSNPHEEPCTAVWFVLARRDDCAWSPTATPAAWSPPARPSLERSATGSTRRTAPGGTQPAPGVPRLHGEGLDGANGPAARGEGGEQRWPMQGTEAEFDAFYRGTARRVVHLVYASTGDLTLAQDCTQEAYARAWQQWSTVRTLRRPPRLGAHRRPPAGDLRLAQDAPSQERAYERHGESTARPPGPRARTVSPSSRPCAPWPNRCARPSPCTTSAT